MGLWISENWRIANITLNFQKSGQTAEEIVLAIMNTLEKYYIKDKVFALTMDNTTTNKAINQLLQNKLQNTKLITIETHWNSTLAMFERYLHLYPAIHEICSKEPLMPSCLNNKDFINLKSFCQLFKLFTSGMLVLSKENSNSISNAIMVILEIGQHINKLKHLKATLIEVGNYSENNTEVFVNNIQQKIILYGMKYASTRTLTVETVETVEIVESNDLSLEAFHSLISHNSVTLPSIGRSSIKSISSTILNLSDIGERKLNIHMFVHSDDLPIHVFKPHIPRTVSNFLLKRLQDDVQKKKTVPYSTHYNFNYLTSQFNS
ncbi:22825_t:CDS:2 [Cetraspora pellucida]|uniref:22825_t:CDS:1 n=1 Tax=Cetraspora pellucida TaxID=1433469 RepID=A0A9N9CF61_9GLOM|nr:22825_t:CDS:2 [Cetraspora pellucida]